MREIAGDRPPRYGGVEKKRFANDRGGQAPALRLSGPSPFIVGLGPSDATRASERVSLAIVPRTRPLSTPALDLIFKSAATGRDKA